MALLDGWSGAGASFLTRWCLQDIKLKAGSLDYSLGVEALRKKVVRLGPSKKREGKDWGWKRENWWLLVSWFQSLRFFICSDSCVLDSQNHFNESPLFVNPVGVVSSQLWFRLCFRSFLLIVHLPDSNIGIHLFHSTIKSETLYSLLRISFADHQIQFTSILGRSALSVSECVLGVALLIPEPLQAFTMPLPGQSCHFLDHTPRNTASGRRHPGSRSL